MSMICFKEPSMYHIINKKKSLLSNLNTVCVYKSLYFQSHFTNKMKNHIFRSVKHKPYNFRTNYVSEVFAILNDISLKIPNLIAIDLCKDTDGNKIRCRRIKKCDR